MGYAVRGWYLYSFLTVEGACLDDGRHCRGWPYLRPRCDGEEDRDHAYTPTVYTADGVASRSSQTNLQTRTIFYCLGGAVTETPDMSVEIARRTHAYWVRRSYLHELYDKPKVALSLKNRLIKVRAVEALLHGCITWDLRHELYSRLHTVHTGSCFGLSEHRAKDQTVGWPRTTVTSRQRSVKALR